MSSRFPARAHVLAVIVAALALTSACSEGIPTPFDGPGADGTTYDTAFRRDGLPGGSRKNTVASVEISPDGGNLTTIDRPKVLAGRMPTPTRPDEAIADRREALRHSVRRARGIRLCERASGDGGQGPCRPVVRRENGVDPPARRSAHAARSGARAAAVTTTTRRRTWAETGAGRRAATAAAGSHSPADRR